MLKIQDNITNTKSMCRKKLKPQIVFGGKNKE